MRSLRSLFSHDFSLHIPQDETHFNPCLRQEQIDVEHHLFSALHTGVDMMVRDQGLS